MADDELILAHRDSEWTGHAPILEEDIAFSNIAQDELGHALIWYGLLQELGGEDPDQLVYFRQPADYRNCQMVELPNGDWAYSMLRQYLFDAAESVHLNRLINSRFRPMAEAAAKIRLEEQYHLRHTSSWSKRLGLGTGESNQRMQEALNKLWPYIGQLFGLSEQETTLVTAGILPEPNEVWQEWQVLVLPFLEQAGLRIPEEKIATSSDRRLHSQHLTTLLAELQEVARMDTEALW
jgi:ring-1,2-phenylacetyl-CoA epoxidase subunit PaaC